MRLARLLPQTRLALAAGLAAGAVILLVAASWTHPLPGPAVWRYLPALAIAVLCGLLANFTACGTPSPEDIAKAIAAVAADPALMARQPAAGSAYAHFIGRRVTYLVGKNSGWATESGYTSLKARIGSEMDQVAAVVTERTTTLTGTDPASPGHRDLDDAAKRLVTDGPTAIATRAAQYRSDRTRRIAQIIWRACAVQPELWSGGDSTLTPTLANKDGLKEVLDRRLHAVEVMLLHDDLGGGSWTLASASSGWTDQQRTVMFEYPWVDETDDFRQALTAAGLTVSDLAANWDESENRLTFRSTGIATRLRPEAAGNWTYSSSPYRLTLQQGVTGTDAMESLIPIAPTTDPSFTDFWERNWLFCDLMIAALHLQGLRFARRRRTNADTDFNNATAPGVTLVPIIPSSGAPRSDILMVNGAQWFEGVAKPHDDLQVGDHIVFWNSQFVRFILGSAFGLENSFVTGTAADGRALILAGHGMEETTEGQFAEAMAKEIKRAYDALRTFLTTKLAADPTLTIVGVKHGQKRFQLVKWAPFGELFGPGSPASMQVNGAWWIRLKLELLHDPADPPPTMTQALAEIPKSVRVDPSRNTEFPNLPAGDFQPDYQESIYLPLSTPAGVRGGWPEYFKNPKSEQGVDIDDLIPDGSMVPGWYLSGQGPSSTIPAFRPKVQS